MNAPVLEIYYSVGKTVMDRRIEGWTTVPEDHRPSDDPPRSRALQTQPMRERGAWRRWLGVPALVLRLRQAK